MAGASLPWTAVGATVTAKASPGAPQAAEEVVVSLGAGARHQADPERQGGHREPTLAVVEVLVDEGLDQAGPLGGHLAHEGLGVDLPDDEVDRAAGLVEPDLAPDPDHHAGLQGDAQAVEGGADRAPGTRPALGAQCRGAGIVGLGRVDEVQEAVALGQDLHRAHLAGDPDLLGEGTPDGAVDPVVELRDGQRVGATVLGHQPLGA